MLTFIRTFRTSVKFTKNIRLMANSKFEYVKLFEQDPQILPNCWFVVRIDGKNFHKFSVDHRFEKPNDKAALDLMNFAAALLMREFKDIVIGFGTSDEYSFVFRRSTEIFGRRTFKIVTYVNSYFTSLYTFYWPNFFADRPLKYPAYFDARIVMYPSDENIKDYLKWRQADVHINNLYNTTFWALIQKGGLTNAQAKEKLDGTLASDKNEIMFKQFNMNYNNEPIMYRKGTILVRKITRLPSQNKNLKSVVPLHESLIDERFWTEHSELLQYDDSATVTPVYQYENGQPVPDIIEQQFYLFKT